MKILTNKTIGSFLSKLTLDSIPVQEKVEKIQFVIQFIDWLVETDELSAGDAIRFRNELYKKKRELSHKQAPKLPLPLKYVGFSLGILSVLLVVGGIYIRFFRTTRTPFAYSTAPVQAGRTISFQGRLTDSLGNPINAPIDITYNFYTAPTGGTPITGSTRVCTAGPDQDGVFSSLIGNDSGPSCNTELPNSIFTENPTVYLGVTVGTEPSEMTPRQQIANVGYAINSETLQGMPPGQSVSNIPFINQDGNMLIGASNPGIRSTYASSNFTISSAQATTIQSAGSGDITLSASEGGSLRFKAYNGTLEEVMTILNTGRVGIGITAPRALLDVNGDATVSGSLIAGGQIKVGEFTSPPTNLGNGSLYYDSNTNKIYFWNGTSWADMASGTTQYFQRTLGSLAPTNITDDLNLGAVATGSAIVHLPGTNNQNAWFNLGTGNVGIGTTSPTTKLEIIGSTSNPDINIGNNIGSQGGGAKFFSTNYPTYFGTIDYNAGGNTTFTVKNTYSGGAIKFYTGATEVFAANNGSFTVGGATPVETLTVAGSGGFEGGLFLKKAGPTYVYSLLPNFSSTDGLSFYSYQATIPGTKMEITKEGNVGIGDTTPASLFTVGNGDLFQIDSSGRIVTLDGVAHSIDDASGDLTLTSNSTTISLNDNVSFAGTTTLNGLTYSWPGTQPTGYILQTNGSGTLSWADPTSLAGGANLWTLANGSLYPVNATVDTFIGGTASASAKFAFLNVNSGTPTASVAGSLANVATYLTGDGNLATTNMAALTVGGASTGSIQLSPKGTTGLFVDGSGNVGVGTTSPTTNLDVNGNIGLSQGNFIGYPSAVAQSYTPYDALFNSILNSTKNIYINIDSDNNDADSTAFVVGKNRTSDSGGSELFRVNENGTVGIGVSPSYTLDVSGDINLTGAIHANGDAGTSGYILTSAGGGVNTWTDPSTLGGGANLWKITNGALYPVNATVDAFIGGTASASAKFAFLNVNAGTPTASISGTTANVNTFIDGNGNIGTTNRTSLVLGNSATYDSTGNILLNPNGTGNVGIGLTSPNSLYSLDAAASLYSGAAALHGSISALGEGYAIRADVEGGGNIGLFSNISGPGIALQISDIGSTLNHTIAIDQSFSTKTGDVLFAAMANGSGSFTGNFINFMNAGTTVFKIDSNGNTTSSANMTLGGQLQIGRFDYEPSAVGVGSLYFNTTNNTPYYHNGTSWTAFSAGGANYWNIANGAIYPINSTLDMFIGGTASASAKFAFLNVNSGTPTASVAGSLANVATYLTGDGNLATTNMAALTVGGASTGSIQLSPKGTTGLFVDGSGNVGVGDATPTSLFTVGSGDLFQINSSGQIGAQQSPVSDYLFSLAGTTGNDNSRIIDITQANDATEDSAGIYLVSTANPGTVTTTTTRNIRGLFSSLTPTVTSTGTAGLPQVNVIGNDQTINVSNTTLGDSSFNSAFLATYGNKVNITGTPIINNADASYDQAYHRVFGTQNTLILTPTLTATDDVSGTYFGTNNTVSVTSAGNIGYTPTVYGTYNNVYGDLTTTGVTTHLGEYTIVSGTAVNNHGLSIGGVTQGANNYGISIYNIASSATNYSLYSAAAAQSYFAGSLGVGNLTPTYKLDVTGDINLTGAIRTNGSAGTTGYILTSAGGGVNTWTDPASLITGGESLWTILNGALYPTNATVDAFIGGTASASAKFAFLNVNAGTPTASISGTTANVNTFIDGNGNIGTTNRKTLTIGNSTTYNTTGNVLINPNAASNVGIGTVDPQTLFHVQQAAVTSTAEEIARFNISDDATAYFSLRNGSTTDGLFSPQMRFRGSGSTTAGNIQAMITTDTGTSPALVFTSQLASSALVTRPVLAVRNYTTDLMTVLANGSVGIGTTSPLAALDIRKTSGTTPVASISGATSKSTLVVDQSGVGDIITASSSGETRFVVKNNGNVGIGYTNPTYKLAVNGSILGDILYDTTNPSYYVDPSGDSVFGGGLSLVGGFTASSASVSGSLTMGYGGQLKSAYGPLNLAYKSGLDSWTTGLVLQDTTGNVGIGTIAPVANLHVFSAANAQMRLETGTNANATFNILEDGGASDNGAAFALDGTNDIVSWQSVLSGVGTNILSIPYAGTYANRIGINTTTPLASLDLRSMLGTIPVASISGNTSQAALVVDQSGVGDIFTASSSGETRFVIKSNGNVGIGVADPTGKLSIAGTSSTISNLSGDIVLDSASGNISFSNDNLINVTNIASIGQIQLGGFASPPTSIGNGAMYYDTTNNKVFYWDGTIWSEMGSKYWQRTLGSLSPQYITDALNLGAIASGSALVHLPGTNNQDAWFNLGTGTVGIGTTTPDPGGYGYKLDVSGTMVADKYVDSASNSYYVDPAGDSVLGGNLTLGDIFMIDGTPLISSLNAGSYSTITIKGSGDTTTASLCVDEGTGSACDGKINAGTIDPPYTINGKKYATYLPSMTGVKEETTGKVLLTERNEEAKAYIKRIALGNQPEDSDLWLFAKATNLKDQIQDMTVLLSSNTNGKTWYSVDQATMVLTFYSSTPSEISYRLTAPRFDAGRWANTRHENDFGTGFVLNDRGNILAGEAPTYTAPKIVAQGTVFSLIGNFIEEFTAANQALFANITAGIVNTQKIVSPVAEIDTLKVTNKTQSKEIDTELLKASNSIETPRLNTNAIDIGTQSGQLAKLVINGLYNAPVVTIDAEGSATFAGTLTAESVQTENASISGTLVAKEIQSETIDALSTQLASNSSTLASSYQELSGDINAVQQELAALRTSPLPNASYYQNLDATYNSLSITDTANIYKAYISDSLVVGSLFMEDHSILALASDLSISSLGTVTFFDGSIVMAKNGNITSKGEVTASSLAIKNKEGVTVAEIDASGSARFNEVIAKKFSLESIATQGALIADSGVVNNSNVPIPAIKTNAEVAGIGAVPQDTKEVIIYNDNVTENSLIYLTPTSENAQGQLSVSKKVSCAQNSPLPCTPYFIVSSSLLIHTETPFNWLIIN